MAVRGGAQLGVLATSEVLIFFPRARSELGSPLWRCGEGLNSEFLLPARCSLFSLAPEASWGAPPWRCAAGLNSRNAQGLNNHYDTKENTKNSTNLLKTSWALHEQLLLKDCLYLWG